MMGINNKSQKVKIIRFLLSLLSIFFLHDTSSAQKLKIDERIPELEIENTVNYPSTVLNTSDFSDKLLILDFWSFGCTACIKSWPKLMEVQKKFKSKVQILLVNTDNTAEEISKFIKNQERIHGYTLNLPVANGNKFLNTLFPHQNFPHIVYINKGILKYVTVYLTPEMVSAAIEEGLTSMKLEEKIDTDYWPDWSFPLLMYGNGPKIQDTLNVIQSTLLLRSLPATRKIVDFIDSTQNTLNRRVYGAISGFDPKSIFRFLYGKIHNQYYHIFPVPVSRVRFEGVDSTKLVSRINGIPTERNQFTLQFTSDRNVSIPSVMENMSATLQMSLGIRVRMVKMLKKSIIISKNKNALPIPADDSVMANFGENVILSNNLSVQEFIDRLIYYVPSFQLSDFPIVDETGFSGKLGNIKISVKGKTIDYFVLKAELQRYGLEMEIRERKVEILIIEKSGN